LKVACAIETSTRQPSLALWAAGRARSVDLAGERPHASDLLPALDQLLAAAGLAPGALEAVIVGTGPGSYTGLRVGCATALGLARGTGALLRGVPSVEALVFDGVPAGGQAGVLIDARAGEVYFAHYRRTPDDVEAVAPPCVVRRGELFLPAGLPLYADAAALAAAALEERTGDVLGPPRPRAEALLRLGTLRLAQHGPHAPHEVEPLYLRAFAARLRRR
jgi:tRNA threonylcarbamoyladenosine biosynthesis protein TsaB